MSVPTAPNIFIRPDCSESHRADFYWGPPTSDGGSPISSYTLTMTAPSSFSVSVPSTYDEINLGGLTNGIQYTFTLTAQNVNGSSPAATFRQVYPGVNPGPIGDFYVQKESKKSGTVYYTESIGDGQGALTIFNVARANRIDSSGNPILNSNSTILGALANQTSIYFNNLISSQTYSFTPQSINDPGYSVLPKGTNPLFFPSSMVTGFSPSTIAGLQTWLDASDPSYVFYSGGLVSTIVDKASGLNYNSTPATYSYPTYGSTINTLSTIYFAIANGIQNNSNLILSNVTNLFMVGRERPDSNYGTYYPFLLGDDTNYYWHNEGSYYIGNSVNGSPGIQDSSGILMTEMIADIVSTTASSIRLVKPGKTFLLNLNNITGSTDYKGIFYDRDLSQTAGQYRGWSGDFAEMLLYSSALSQSDINSITQYLQEKWSTTPKTTNDLLCWMDASVSKYISTSTTSNINTIFDKGLLSSIGTPTNNYYDPESESIYSFNNGYINLSDFSLPYDNTSYTIFYVGSIFDPTSGRFFFSGNNGGAGINDKLYSYTDGAAKVIQSFGADLLYSSNSISPSNQYIFTFSYDETTNTRYTYINGVLEGYDNPSLPRSNWPTSNCLAGVPGFLMNGTLNEFIVFNRYLSGTERGVIEQNLGQKWEIYPLYEPPFINFNPRNITGLQLWLDATDNSNYTLSTLTLREWDDKSGFSRNASTITTNGALLNTYSQLFTFPGYNTDARLYLPDNTFPVSSPFTFVMMANIVDTGLPEFTFSVGAEDVSGQFNIWRNYGNQYTSWSNTGGALVAQCPSGGNRIFTFTYTPGQRSMYFNGQLVAEDVQSSRVISSISTFIGGYANPSGIDYSSASVGEIILYNKLLSPNELEVVNSYLKQKWALEPQINFSIQSLSSNIRAWYDASSPDYFTLSGVSTITSWIDRSGNGRHGIAQSNPIYDSTNNSVFFDTGSNSYFALPNNTIPASNSEYDIFAVFSVSSIGGYNCILGAGDSAHTSVFTYTTQALHFIDGASLAYNAQIATDTKYVFRANYKPGRRGIMFNTSNDVSDQINTNSLIASSNAIGYLYAFNLPFYGSIHEILIFNRRLTYTEGFNVSYQLQKKWGIY